MGLSVGAAVPVVFADAPAEAGDAAPVGFPASFAASGFSASYFPAGEVPGAFPGEVPGAFPGAFPGVVEVPGVLVAWGRMVVDDISTALPSTIACGRFGSPPPEELGPEEPDPEELGPEEPDPADPDPDPAVPGVALPASSFLSVMGTRYSTK
ncbi:MAG: hypothetical protein SH859_08790 [Hyphomicrobium aestuarii]|nr:hypothetical protein [Hyphomicrobium aestuarii]